MYCEECTHELPANALKCEQCGTAVAPAQFGDQPMPVIVPGLTKIKTGDTNPIIRDPVNLTAPGKGWWQDQTPDLRASLPILIVLGVITAIPFGIGLLLFPLQIPAFFAQGALTARYALREPRFRRRSPTRWALRSAGWTILFCFAISVVVRFLEVLITGPIGAGTLPVTVISSFGSVLMCFCFVYAGAWVYQRTGGRNMFLISIVIAILGIAAAGGFAVLIYALLHKLYLLIFS